MKNVNSVVGMTSLFIMPAAAVVLRFVTHNVWVGLLAFVGAVLQLFIAVALFGTHSWGIFFPLFFGSVILLVAGMWLGEFQGGWWWSLIWLMFGLRFIMRGSLIDIREQHLRWVAPFMFGFGLFLITLAILGPTWLYPQIVSGVDADALPEQTEGVSGESSPDVGATLIAESILTATGAASSGTPQPSESIAPTVTEDLSGESTDTPDVGATMIAEAMLTATAEAGEETNP